MFFVIKSSTPQTDLAIYRAKRKARLYLTLHTFGPSELLLSRYLQEKYNTNLRAACLAILQNASFNMNLQREIIVTIPDKQLNHLAKLITYGPGTVPGSQILHHMLNIKKEV